MTALGAPIISTATDLLPRFTVALNTVAQWAARHPVIVRDIAVIVASLGALAVASGTAAIAMAALGPATAALRGLFGLLGGASVVSAASGIGALTLALGPFILAVAGAAAAAAGLSYLSKKVLPGTGSSDKVDSFLYRNIPGAAALDDWTARHLGVGRTYKDQGAITHPSGQKSSYVPDARDRGVNVHSIVYLDGEVVYRNTARRMARDASRPSRGMTAFDPSMSLMPSGAALHA